MSLIGMAAQVEGHAAGEDQYVVFSVGDVDAVQGWSVGKDCLGLATHFSRTAFHAVAVVEINGTGKALDAEK